MTRDRWGILAGGILIGGAVTVGWAARGAGRDNPAPLALARRIEAAPVPAAPRRDDPPAPAPAVSVQDALIRPVDLPFGEPTTLLEVQKYLGEALGLAVVLDRAALDRVDVTPEDTVQLNIRGARLKTGLRLLLDQVELTYRVEPEDNLLIITDAAQAGDPALRSLRELKALHEEMHDLRDAVDDLRDLVEDDLGVEPAKNPGGASFVGSARRRPAPRVSTPAPAPRAATGGDRG